MQLSVIMPTYKRPDVLKESYDALVAAVKDVDAEIIVINDDKATTAQSITQQIRANTSLTTVINNPKTGVAAARNFGASIAKGKLLLFIDDDVIINKNNVIRILELHGKFDNILLSPTWVYTQQIQQYFESTPFGRYRLKYDFPATSPKGEVGNEVEGHDNLFYNDTLSSFALSVNKNIYQELQGMDENFPYAGVEDQEFTARALKCGYRLIIDMANVLYHNELHRLDPEVWLNRQSSGIQGFVVYANKNPEKKRQRLWYENTPIARHDTLKLKFKKMVKALLRNNAALLLLSKLRYMLEKIAAPYTMLEKIYKLQAGLYLNKGFTQAYKNQYHHKNTNSNNG